MILAGTPATMVKGATFLGHHSPRSHDCPGSDLHTGKQNCSMADPNIVPQHHRVGLPPIENLPIIFGVQVIGPAPVGEMVQGRSPQRMIAGINAHMAGDGAKFPIRE